MKKKHLAMRLCAIFCIIVGLSITSFADLDKEKEKKEEMEAQLKDTEKFLDSLKSLKTDSEAYIAAIDQQLNRLATNIYDLQQQAMAKQAEIDTKNTEISAKEEEISNQYDDMALRIQYMYENGDAEYASWLLESSTMTDFLNKAEYISQITQYDRDMLVVLQQCKEELATQKAELEVQLSDLSALIAETEAEQYAQETLITAKKNDLNIYTIPLIPKRDMRVIKGTYMEVMDKNFYRDTDTEDYLHVTLTDEEEIPEVIGKLRAVYPNIMKLEYDNTRTRKGVVITGTMDVDKKSPIELFSQFYELQNNQLMNDEQKELIESLVERIWEGQR